MTYSPRAVSLCCVWCWMTRAHSLGPQHMSYVDSLRANRACSLHRRRAFRLNSTRYLLYEEQTNTFTGNFSHGWLCYVCLFDNVCVCVWGGGGDIVFDPPANNHNHHIMTLPRYSNRVRVEKANNSRWIPPKCVIMSDLWWAEPSRVCAATEAGL